MGIPRTRPTRRSTSGVRIVRPRIGPTTLPEWTPSTPPGGWTLTTARAAADRYAAVHAAALERSERGLAVAAFRALADTLAPRLRREDILDRLRSPESVVDEEPFDDPIPF